MWREPPSASSSRRNFARNSPRWPTKSPSIIALEFSGLEARYGDDRNMHVRTRRRLFLVSQLQNYLERLS